MNHLKYLTLSATCIAICLGATSSGADGRDLPVYCALRGGGFSVYGTNKESARVVVAEPIAGPVPISVRTDEGSEVRAVRQRLRILNPQAGSASTINLVTAESPYASIELPLDRRYVVIYFEPKDGKVRLNTSKLVRLQQGDVASSVAVVTAFDRVAPGTNFDERVFGSLIEAASSHDVAAMLGLCEMLPPPPGMVFGTPGTANPPQGGRRKMNEFLQGLSERVASRGGIFNAVFHARLVTWFIDGATPAFVESLLANAGDLRLEEILAFRSVSPSKSELARSAFSATNVDGQLRLVHGAQVVLSDRAAAVLASLVTNPLRDETKVAFVSLLQRDSPKLRFTVCNELARLNSRPERLLNDEADRPGWTDQVRAMSDTWLREYGIGS